MLYRPSSRRSTCVITPLHPMGYTAGRPSYSCSHPGFRRAMPIIRSLDRASATISRYLGSKMCSGRKTFGNRTTLGSGKIGKRSDMLQVPGARWQVHPAPFVSVNCLRLLIHVVHEDVLTERVRRGEV